MRCPYLACSNMRGTWKRFVLAPGARCFSRRQHARCERCKPRTAEAVPDDAQFSPRIASQKSVEKYSVAATERCNSQALRKPCSVGETRLGRTTEATGPKLRNSPYQTYRASKIISGTVAAGSATTFKGKMGKEYLSPALATTRTLAREGLERPTGLKGARFMSGSAIW